MEIKQLLPIYLLICCLNIITPTEPFSAQLYRGDVVYLDEKLGILEHLSIKKYNKTSFATNVNGTLLTDLPGTEIIEIKIYGKLSNEYRPLPLVIRRSICNIFKNEYQWIKNEINSNIPEKCPVKKGFYYLKDFIPNMRLFPKPPWDIKDYVLEGRLFQGEKILGIVKVYVQINTDDEYDVSG